MPNECMYHVSKPLLASSLSPMQSYDFAEDYDYAYAYELFFVITWRLHYFDINTIGNLCVCDLNIFEYEINLEANWTTSIFQ